MKRVLAVALLLAAGCEQEDAGGDGAMFSLPAGSVPRGAAASRAILEAGPAAPGSGAEAYRSFCAPCHGASGAGDGPVIARGFTRPRPFAALPPSATDPARVVEVITEGYGAMLPQAHQIAPAERWTIARHVEALARGGGDD